MDCQVINGVCNDKFIHNCAVIFLNITLKQGGWICQLH
ncbi:hypothetical protein DW125_09025 [Dorea sp. AM10-31]|nr:hypothetical protein DW125_09025 [Dorea sp. AM10-31]